MLLCCDSPAQSPLFNPGRKCSRFSASPSQSLRPRKTAPLKPLKKSPLTSNSKLSLRRSTCQLSLYSTPAGKTPRASPLSPNNLPTRERHQGSELNKDATCDWILACVCFFLFALFLLSHSSACCSQPNGAESFIATGPTWATAKL